ncbi:hypothetical protein HPB52_018240 [Rhipicephalus sanguineus]|uniref:Uncharacterized protein n=1 Tax=Rhipicephalus sanguineus TaxID=34632 RepID=A0A9D4YQJ5_RHISA|nr:hypothetical protein HPB52_018240 [Rhipicephalus sanguineus]
MATVAARAPHELDDWRRPTAGNISSPRQTAGRDPARAGARDAQFPLFFPTGKPRWREQRDNGACASVRKPPSSSEDPQPPSSPNAIHRTGATAPRRPYHTCGAQRENQSETDVAM